MAVAMSGLELGYTSLSGSLGKKGLLWEPISLHVTHIEGNLRSGRRGERPWGTLRGRRGTSLLLHTGN